jgi:radical SAM protein with 4Fe4S-binding SPASM domain
MPHKNAAVAASQGKRGMLQAIRTLVQKVTARPPRLASKLNMVVVEVTTYCNLKCAGCVRTIMADEGAWSNRHMAVDDFRRVIDELPPAALFVPQGIGESTMHPQIVELIEIARQSGKFDRIEINTNGLVRATDFYGKLFEAGLTDLTVSVDTLDPALIERLRAETDIAKLEERLREFASSFPDRIGIRVTVSSGNIARLPDLLRRLNEFGRFKVWLQPFFDMGKQVGVLSRDEVDELGKAVAGWVNDYPNLTVVAEQFLPSAKICPSPWVSPAVTVDGELKPCCMILHQEQVSFGNLLRIPFPELWQSAEVGRFRDAFVERSPACCARCPYYEMRP